MQYSEIRSHLEARDYNFSMLAEASGYSLQHVTQVAKRVHQSRKVEEIIATAIDLPVDQVFDQRTSFARRRSQKLKELKQALSAQVA